MDSKQLVHDVANALYASKICSYAQGMNIIKHKSADKNWDIDLGALARIWKVRTARNCIENRMLFDVRQAQHTRHNKCWCQSHQCVPAYNTTPRICSR